MTAGLLNENECLKAHVRRLSEEVVMLREKSEPKRHLGQFGALLLTAVGKDAFSDELVDIAREAAISDLVKRNSRRKL
jgi:hypothetical protein